jgi:hypothetical protein
MDVTSAAQYEQEWLRHFFDADETIEWLEAGALPGDALSAAGLRAAGMSPVAACRDVPCRAGGCRLRHSPIGRVTRDEISVDEAVASCRTMESGARVRGAETSQQQTSPTVAAQSGTDEGAHRSPAPMPQFSHREG